MNIDSYHAQLVSAYIDGELGVEETLMVKKQLQVSPELRHYMEQLVITDKAIANTSSENINMDTPSPF